MNVRHAYAAWSPTYDSDRNLTRDLDATVTKRLLSGESRRFVLELGCGTGKNTEFLARVCQKLLALDVSPEMLAIAREKIELAHVEFTLADLTASWPCTDGIADLIVCNLVLEHIRDLRFVFSEAQRALATRGMLFISELHPFRQYQGTKATFTREGAAVEIDAHVHHISDFLSAAQDAGLVLRTMNEWWHDEDGGKPPRLITFIFDRL